MPARDDERQFLLQHSLPPRAHDQLPQQEPAQGVTDAQIASIVVTANQVDIDAGKLASANAMNAEGVRGESALATWLARFVIQVSHAEAARPGN